MASKKNRGSIDTKTGGASSDRRTSLTRRSFLASAGTAGAALAAAGAGCGSGAQASSTGTSQVDICIVGGGLAGLVAAREAFASGATAVIVEARDRVGGRVLNGTLESGDPVELGGQWVGPTQTAILDLASQAGVETFPTYNDGDNLLYYRGEIIPYAAASGVPPIPQADLLEALDVIGEIDALSREVGATAPWQHAEAAELDGETVQQWMDRRLGTEGARFLIELSVKSVLSVEPRDVSFLFFLRHVAAAGGVLGLITTPGGAQDSRLVGGSELVALRVADELGEESIRLNHAVRSIRERDGILEVDASGTTIRAGRVIVAVPPTLAGRILYEPAMPARRDQLTQRIPMGSIIKVNVEYTEPFWREAGLSGQFLSDVGPARAGFDNSPPDANVGVLNAFLTGDDARLWGLRNQDERRDVILASLAELFGAAALSPRRYHELDWSTEAWTRGGISAFTGPGVLTHYGPALSEPVGGIHWAGAETSDVWSGHMDGAVRSGIRAINEITSA